MVRWTIFFLILLRLAIGWHFLVEGWYKVQSTYLVGETATSKPFSSAGYFREAPGPLGKAVRRYEGDPDDLALARLVVPSLSPDEDPATAKPHDRVPVGLAKDWDDYVARFTRHYELSEEQAKQAKEKLRQAKSAIVGWLIYLPPDDLSLRDKDTRFASMTTEQTRTFSTGEVKRRMSMAERVGEYRLKLFELRDASGNKLRAFGKDVEGAKLRTMKAEVTRLRAGLMADLDKETKKLEGDLNRILTKGYYPVLAGNLVGSRSESILTSVAVAGCVTGELAGGDGDGQPPGAQFEKVPMATVVPKHLVDYVDKVTPWMLCAIGAMLLIGLFTRLGAFSGAIFLLMTYLAVPALPWLPSGGPAEGNYLFVNKNVIEMLALFALAGIPTGRWFGIDALLYRIWTGGRGKNAPAKA